MDSWDIIVGQEPSANFQETYGNRIKKSTTCMNFANYEVRFVSNQIRQFFRPKIFSYVNLPLTSIPLFFNFSHSNRIGCERKIFVEKAILAEISLDNFLNNCSAEQKNIEFSFSIFVCVRFELVQ